MSSKEIALFATPPHPCNYLENEEAITTFVDPALPKNSSLYSLLAIQGFRRSGEHIYRPACAGCQQCVMVRVDASAFKHSRNQKRTWKKNQDLEVIQCPTEFKQEHFDLYKRYLNHRHPEGGMENPVPDSYREFLLTDWADGFLLEFRLDQKLLAVAVLDQLNDGLSAVYTFFDPDYAKRSLGRLGILYEIELVKSMGLRWLYLGYWIKGCQKMEYKQEYLPQERFIANQWSLYTQN